MRYFFANALLTLCLVWGAVSAPAEPRVAPTERYRREVLRLMIAEANRIATDLKLAEMLPITRTNLMLVWLIPAGKTYGPVGVIDTASYSYTMEMKSFGVVCSGLARKGYEDFHEARTNYVIPIAGFDSNRTFQTAVQLMKKAGMDADKLNRDCRIRIDFPKQKGGLKHTFSPIYSVTWWQKTNTFQLKSGDNVAHVEFIEPSHRVRAFHVSEMADMRYNLRKPLEIANLRELLTPENSEEAVRNEMDMSTNYVTRMKDLLQAGAEESLLRKVWAGYSDAPFPTNILYQTNVLRSTERE